jgi:hypothetical protein
MAASAILTERDTTLLRTDQPPNALHAPNETSTRKWPLEQAGTRFSMSSKVFLDTTVSSPYIKYLNESNSRSM